MLVCATGYPFLVLLCICIRAIGRCWMRFFTGLFQWRRLQRLHRRTTFLREQCHTVDTRSQKTEISSLSTIKDSPYDVVLVSEADESRTRSTRQTTYKYYSLLILRIHSHKRLWPRFKQVRIWCRMYWTTWCSFGTFSLYWHSTSYS